MIDCSCSWWSCQSVVEQHPRYTERINEVSVTSSACRRQDNERINDVDSNASAAATDAHNVRVLDGKWMPHRPAGTRSHLLHLIQYSTMKGRKQENQWRGWSYFTKFSLSAVLEYKMSSTASDVIILQQKLPTTKYKLHPPQATSVLFIKK